MLPLTALIIGTSVLGAEIDDGSIVYLLATPVSRAVVIGAKYAVAVVLTMIFAAVPELVGKHRHRRGHETRVGRVRWRTGRIGNV